MREREVNARHLYERKIKQIMPKRQQERENLNSSQKVEIDVKYNYNKRGKLLLN